MTRQSTSFQQQQEEQKYISHTNNALEYDDSIECQVVCDEDDDDYDDDINHTEEEEEEEEEEEDEIPPEINGFGLTWVFLTPAALGLLYGFDLGATSFVLAHLFLQQQQRRDEDDPLALLTTSASSSSSSSLWWNVDDDDDDDSNNSNAWKRGWFIATLSLGAWFGSHLAFVLTHHHHHHHHSTMRDDATSNTTTTSSSSSSWTVRNFRNIGRRCELQICAMLYAMGTLANVMSGTVFAYSSPTVGFAVLVLGRLLFGMGVGFIMHGAPAYMAEMCPDQVRGAVVTAKEAMIVSGILIGYTVGNGFLGDDVHQHDPTAGDYDDEMTMMNRLYANNMTVDYNVVDNTNKNNSIFHLVAGAGRWTVVYAVMFLATLPLLFLALCIIPESHRWLLRQEQTDEAFASLQFVYRTDTHDHYERVMGLWDRLVLSHRRHHYHSQRSSSSSSSSSPLACASSPSMHIVHKNKNHNNHLIMDDDDDDDDDSIRPTSMFSFVKMLWADHPSALLAAMGLIVFQQLSGQPCILSYAPAIWKEAGWSGNASVVTAMLMLCTAMGTVLLVDVIGRKRLLQACCITMSTALFLLALCFWQPPQTTHPHPYHQQQHHQHHQHVLSHHHQAAESVSSWWTTTTLGSSHGDSIRRWLIVVGMFAYVAGYQMGFGPITWLVVSEVFPMHVRGPAIAAGVQLNYLLNFVVQFALAGMQDTMGWGPTFLVFGLVVVVASLYIQHFVPETKGLSLEDIEDEMVKRTTTKAGTETKNSSLMTKREGAVNEKSSLLSHNNNSSSSSSSSRRPYYTTRTASLSSSFDKEEECTMLSLNSSEDSIDI